MIIILAETGLDRKEPNAKRSHPSRPFRSGSFYLVRATNFLNLNLSIFAELRDALARSVHFLLQFLDRAGQTRDVADGLLGLGLFLGLFLFDSFRVAGLSVFRRFGSGRGEASGDTGDLIGFLGRQDIIDTGAARLHEDGRGAIELQEELDRNVSW